MININVKKDKLRVSLFGLVVALIYSIGVEIDGLPEWGHALTPGGVGGMLMAMGGAVIGWMTPRPARPSLRRKD